MNPDTPPTPPVEDASPRPLEASTTTATSSEESSFAVETPPIFAGVKIPVLTSGGAQELKPADTIRRHDFRQSSFLTPTELRRLRLRHEQFARALAARMSLFLRGEFVAQLANVEISTYQKCADTIPSPAHITLFKIDPLKGTSLLVIPPRLGLSFVDRLLGGPGRPADSNRDFSEIEIAVIDQVSTLLLAEWCNQWIEMRDLRPALLGHEDNGRYLQSAAPDTAMLVATFDIAFGEVLETVRLAFPYTAIEPLVRLLAPAGTSDQEGPELRSAKLKWNAEFDEVQVPVVAEWQGLKLSAGAITRLKSGDVLMLDPRCVTQVQLRLSHIPKFIGRPGTRAGKWAVELTAPAVT
jgi:flagellar motor switch protein FliM